MKVNDFFVVHSPFVIIEVSSRRWHRQLVLIYNLPLLNCMHNRLRISAARPPEPRLTRPPHMAMIASESRRIFKAVARQTGRRTEEKFRPHPAATCDRGYLELGSI